MIYMYEWILQSDLSPNEKIVLSCLWTLQSKNECKSDYVVITSKIAIAKNLCMSNRTLDVYLNRLKDKGYIIKFNGLSRRKTLFLLRETENDRIINELSVKWRKW